MTARPDADAALALLRAEFPEPLWVNLSLRGGGGGRWYAVAQTRPWPCGDDSGIPGGFITIDAKGESRDEAARALIAAWREATKPLTDGRTYFDASAESAAKWRECADALAKTLKAIQWREAVLYESGLEACVYMCVDAIHAVERSLARYDALRKEFPDA